MNIKEQLRKIFFPLPCDQKSQGFQPNFYIKYLRGFADILIFLMRLNGKNRFSNEFIQALNPAVQVSLPNHKSLTFRTGHGRLFWRAKTLLTEEPKIIEWIDSFSEDDVFYDIGANVGNYSIYAGQRNIKTFSFEPEPLNVSLMFENIFMNNLENFVSIMPIGLASKSAMLELFLKDISKGDALHSLGRPSYLVESKNSFKKLLVPSLSLDEAVAIFNMPKPTKIKIDVDGNELEILKGGIATIGMADEIYIELDFSYQEHVQAHELLKELAFEIKWSEDKKREWNNSINHIYKKGK